MRVLKIYKDYYPPIVGGIEKHINMVANGLKHLGVDIEVLVSNTCPKTITENINGIQITKTAEFGRFASAPINPILPYILKKKAINFDLLHFYLPNPTAVLAFWFNKIDKPYIVTYHSDIVRQAKLKKIYLPFEKVFLRKARQIIASSPNYIASSDILKKHKNKCRVIPVGIDIGKFNAFNNNEKFVPLKHNEKFVLFVGKFRHYKGVHVLIEAMKQVNAKLLIVGDGVLRKDIVNQVARDDLSHKIRMLGELKDEQVYSLMKRCNMLVLPSTHRSEAFGIVLLEAMACGRPVISTELGTGTSYINEHGKTGIVVKPNDPNMLANAINYLLDNPKEGNRLGNCGRERVRSEFSSDGMIKKTFEIYQKVFRKSNL